MHRIIRQAVSVTLSAATVACDAEPTAPTSPSSFASDRFAWAVETALGTPDSRLVRIAQRVPGFGGVYVDSSGRAVVWLAADTQLAAASRAMAEVLGRLPSIDSRGWRIRRTRYDLQQLYEWRRSLLEELSLDHLVYIDLDEAGNQVWVAVDRPSAIPLVRAAARRRGIPDAAAQVVTEARPHQLQLITNEIRPLTGGMRIGASYGSMACTSSLVGYRASAPSVPLMVTNGHCSFTQGALDTMQYGAPFGGAPIVQEEFDPPFWYVYDGRPNAICTPLEPFCVTFCPSVATGGCRWGDVSSWRFIQPTSVSLYAVATTSFAYFGTGGDGSLAYTGTETLTAWPPEYLYSGERMDKVGATSGWTAGPLNHTCTDVGMPGNRMLLCQYTVLAEARGGDSGSPVIWDGAAGRYLTGILWGANSTQFTFSPLWSINADLGIQIP